MKITYDDESRSFLVDLQKPDDEEGVRGVAVPLQAVASWSELLGYDDLADCLDAIIDARVNAKEPESCPVTGYNDVWTAPYEMLREREEKREREYLKAQAEGKTADDPRSPLLRSTLAAFHALPRDERGVCALDQAREASCEALGVPKPKRTPSLVRRTVVTRVDKEAGEMKISAPTCEEESQCDRDGFLCKEDRAKCVQVLREHALDIAYRETRFQHSQTSIELDPLEPHLAVTADDEQPQPNKSPEEMARERYMSGGDQDA
ncbi:hypothetical protein ACFP47_10105 [Nesterenkonia lacusekhoensis]|uniref:Uncharacterized protein n=1 Tax=Nesterenkonia lacusekhoensis TaxID=150832 RepID=A0ABS4T6P7_9MICC|nr:hypothetical protein [Nesterenkonia lacusekhoensis]MBP2319553.1 hypothetical protein [Nesterenkonia lacusekhoensis]